MKKLLTLLTCGLLLAGCATTQYSPILDAALSMAVGEALLRGVHNSADRTATANYIDFVATVLRGATTETTPEELGNEILAALPPRVKSRYPEIELIVRTLVVPAYKAAYDQFKGNAGAFLAAVNRIASDIELGASLYISH